jgi:hypothetical protein
VLTGYFHAIRCGARSYIFAGAPAARLPHEVPAKE